MMKDLLTQIKTNPELKTKVTRGAIFFILFIAGVIGFAIYNSGSGDKELAQDETNKIQGNMIPADTTQVASKDELYVKSTNDSMTALQNNSGNILGGSVTQQQNNEAQGDAMLDNYMVERQKSVTRMQNSGNTSSASSYRRSYNPNGNSSDWTQTPTTATSNRITSNTPVISTPNYRRDYDPNNPTNSTSDALQSSPVSTTQPTVKTKEQRLQESIASKFNKSDSGGQNISVTAQIYNNQSISANNTSVRIVLTEKLYVNNTTIGTDAFIYGIASVGQNSVNITVPNVSYKGNNYQLNLVAYDYRTGEKGIPVKQENITGTITKEAENQINQEAGRLGRVGSVLSSVLNGRNKSASITLNDGHRIYLKSK